MRIGLFMLLPCLAGIDPQLLMLYNKRHKEIGLEICYISILINPVCHFCVKCDRDNIDF